MKRQGSEVLEEMTDRLRQAPRCRLVGEFARQTHPSAPLDRPPPVVRRADRWQERGDESVLYLCDCPEGAWAEFTRKVAASAGLDPSESVRNFGMIALALDDVVDLSDRAIQELLEITTDDLIGEDTSLCRALLAAARCIGLDAIVAPSAAWPAGKTIIVLPHVTTHVVVVFQERRTPPTA